MANPGDLLDITIGFDSIITGAGPGGGPQVEAWQTPSIHDASGTGMTHSSTPTLLQFSLATSFDAYAPSFTGGVRVGALNHAVGTDFLTGAGSGGGSEVETFGGLTQTVLSSFFALAPSFGGGVTVAGN